MKMPRGHFKLLFWPLVAGACRTCARREHPQGLTFTANVYTLIQGGARSLEHAQQCGGARGCDAVRTL
jgi:hypothetical protein